MLPARAQLRLPHWVQPGALAPLSSPSARSPLLTRCASSPSSVSSPSPRPCSCSSCRSARRRPRASSHRPLLTSPRVNIAPASKAARASAGWRSGGLSQRHTVRRAASSCGQPARPPPPSPLFLSVPETGKRALAELRGGASPSQGIQKSAWPRLGAAVVPRRRRACLPTQSHCPHCPHSCPCPHSVTRTASLPTQVFARAALRHRGAHLTPTPTLTLHAVRTLTPTPTPNQAQAHPYCTRTPPPYLACA